MPYIRLSIAKPRKGEEANLENLLKKLNDLSEGNDGCIASYVMKPHDSSGEIARIAIYDSEAAGEAAANNQSVMSIRSEIHLACEPGHVERAFFTA